MGIVAGFGFSCDVMTGHRRKWYYDKKDKVRRWVDTGERVFVNDLS